MKYKKQEKRYLALDYYEWKELVNGINEYRKQVIDEGGYVDFIGRPPFPVVGAVIDRPQRAEIYRLHHEEETQDENKKEGQQLDSLA